ncbi:MAG: hypothetical protein ACWGSD_03295, partial [Thermodesulfobacteriota bacterium]
CACQEDQSEEVPKEEGLSIRQKAKGQRRKAKGMDQALKGGSRGLSPLAGHLLVKEYLFQTSTAP